MGGGICGILAAKMCGDRRWPYVLVERSEELGGVWNTLANTHSYLQASGEGRESAAGATNGPPAAGNRCDRWVPAALAAAAPAPTAPTISGHPLNHAGLRAQLPLGQQVPPQSG